MINKLKRVKLAITTMILIVIYNILSYATNTDVDAPTLTEVKSIVSDGIDLFFGALGGFAVIMGGIEFFKGFLAFRDADAKGGYGESRSKAVHHIIAGVFCLIGAVLVFTVLGWAKDLFGI